MEHQKALLTASIEIQEKERKRIGEDLHHGLGNALNQVVWEIDVLKRSHQSAQSDLEKLKTQINQIIHEKRVIEQQLYPKMLEMEGLIGAVESICDQLNERQIINAEVINGIPNLKLLKTTELTLYRMIQELTTNTIRHAEATELEVKFEKKGEYLNIEVRDNGKGIDKTTINKVKGIGLTSIDTRLKTIDGTFYFENRTPRGLKSTISIPINTTKNGK